MKSTQPNDSSGWFEKLSSLLEKNIVGVKLGIYSVALCGLGIALRSVKPFKKFSSPSEIPSSFFESQIKLNGTVTGIDLTRSLLIVDHNPIFFKNFRKPKNLPINIEGIDITINGVSWLQTILLGSHIEFILLQKNSHYVNCIVYHKKRNVGNHLVSLGFASVGQYNFDLTLNETYLKYYRNLLKEEGKAQHNEAGMWMENGKKSWFSFFPLFKLSIFKEYIRLK